MPHPLESAAWHPPAQGWAQSHLASLSPASFAWLHAEGNPLGPALALHSNLDEYILLFRVKTGVKGEKDRVPFVPYAFMRNLKPNVCPEMPNIELALS